MTYFALGVAVGIGLTLIVVNFDALKAFVAKLKG